MARTLGLRFPAMSGSDILTVADIRAAISDASDEEREEVKAQFREVELARPVEDQRQTVLDATLPAQDQPTPDPVYSRQSLIEGARSLFDRSPHIVAGALAGARETFTLGEAEQKVIAFAGAEHGGEQA